MARRHVFNMQLQCLMWVLVSIAKSELKQSYSCSCSGLVRTCVFPENSHMCNQLNVLYWCQGTISRYLDTFRYFSQPCMSQGGKCELCRKKACTHIASKVHEDIFLEKKKRVSTPRPKCYLGTLSFFLPTSLHDVSALIGKWPSSKGGIKRWCIMAHEYCFYDALPTCMMYI